MALDDLVKEIVPYNPKPIWMHLYVWPFVVLYAVCISTWTMAGGGFGGGGDVPATESPIPPPLSTPLSMENNESSSEEPLPSSSSEEESGGRSEYFEAGCIAMVAVGVAQILTVLFCQWFVSVRCWMTCTKASSALDAKLVKAVPTPNNGSAELVPLYVSRNSKGEKVIWFNFQKLKYIYDYNDESQGFRAVTFPADRKFSFYQQAKGHDDEASLVAAREHYGNNRMDMAIPTFSELFQERATAPFFAFQVFCVGLWCLDEYWYYSVFTLFMLVTFEATLVKQQLRNMAEIRNMGNKPYMINVYRSRKWTKISTDELVAGDIVSVTRSRDETTLPCDILLIRGTCIVDESMLTGESILQMKESIEDAESDKRLDEESDGKLFLLFGGTKVAQHTPPAKNSAGLKAPDNGCVGYVLRTGFNTSQGRLLRTILFGVKRVTANNKETFGFILFLLIFAIAAAAYVWIKGSEDESRSKYKLFLECTLILTSVVPPELPIELSLAVNNSLLALQKLGVYCTEPFRIPFAGKVDICCFDKTGTLTTDSLIVEGVAGIDGSTDVTPMTDAPPETIQILASCHSLVQMEDELVGDPLEKACLFAVEWALTRNDTVMPKKSKQLPLRIIHRYHFSSAMKRMSVIAGYIPVGTSEPNHLAVVKGAPETLKAMFRNAPDNYDRIYQKFTRQGARVLALGVKELGQLSHQQVRDLTRDRVESELNYAGFVIVSCPLKGDSKAVIKEIQYSSHEVVMITGDNPLTACHVAKVLRFTKGGSTVLILDQSRDGDFKWISVDGSVTLDVLPSSSNRRGEIDSFIGKYDMCITGQAFTYLSETYPEFLAQILPRVKVFARMAPKQKEHIITGLNHLGHVTMMCGDGTNDVGALKHADVGVALLSHPLLVSEKQQQQKPSEPSVSSAAGGQNEVNNGPKKPASESPASKIAASSSAGARKRIATSKREDARAAANVAQGNTTQKKLQQMMKDLEEEEKAQVVRLGDASVAAPFTSKYSSIQSTCHVIKQGRCTLVTTLQMFKILALNALVLAYSQSVLYLDGIKFSDTQATMQGLLIAACFLFISRSKPLKSLSQQRPLTNIFNIYTLLTVTCQFAVHFLCLVHLVGHAHAISPPKEEKVAKLDSKFEPNILNTTVYIISVALQVSTFAVNYRGRPFMESLLENKALAWSLVASFTSVLALASGMIPELTEKFELVILPNEHRNTVVLTLFADMIGCFIIDRILQFLFGDVRVRRRPQKTASLNAEDD